ncbi:DUF6706 family protein [Dyadobacter sp. LHD-138]|uniref:DUF6706 family protein n=1 Tax=Dyadobacter sp. LHD-138 TaxID=3071413 RepID=UPI0027E1C764|nr:DUF6706 family protein [Dyadobacter sp. LHD-138]MDQ6482225.1 hypothetical protein [Dyadobacter sp. LHD-138]
MTNLTVIKHLIGSNAKLSDERLEVAAELAGIDPSSDYDPANKCAIYGLAISEIQKDKGIKSESEDNYSVTYTDSSIPDSLLALAQESGCPDLIEKFDTQPKVRDRSNCW